MSVADKPNKAKIRKRYAGAYQTFDAAVKMMVATALTKSTMRKSKQMYASQRGPARTPLL